MKLGVFTTLLSNKPFDEACAYFKSKGIEMVEIGCGGYPGNAHANPDVLLNDENALNEFKATLSKYDLQISALSCHGNPVHPNKEIAAEFDKVKLTLGELKSIEEGLIVDLCSVYDNKISLKVGGKTVALGELVIINDRFGVRIENVSSNEEPAPQVQEQYEEEAQNSEEDFDYSDFEVEESEE